MIENADPLRPVQWREGRLWLLDQTALPAEYNYLEYNNWQDVARAIKTMVVRGAPAIGCTAAFGMALAAGGSGDTDRERVLAVLSEAADGLKRSRPTAVNLFWAVDRMLAVAAGAPGGPAEIRAALEREANTILDEDIQANRRMGAFGAELLARDVAVLTHCNAGALATGGYGTALGVIRAAVEAGKRVHVFADETRPRLQGMKLTAWELARDGIPVTIIADNAAASLMRAGRIDCVVVGADRIAANGDTANKIGTYAVAVLAKHHGLPFYVAAPLSTIDPALESGDLIPIEERPAEEVTHIGAARVAPEGASVLNPAFDVTPAGLVTAFITEHGVLHPPFTAARLARLSESAA